MLTFIKIILFGFQVAAFIVAAWKYNLYKKSTQRYFLFFLGYIVINEVTAYVLGYHFQVKNLFLYNIFTVISFPFYLYWFGLILKQKKIVQALAILFVVSVIVAIFNESFVEALWKIPLTTGTVLVLICSGFFYYDLLNKKEVVHFQKSQKFWIVTGLLIFYIGYLPIGLTMDYISNNFIGLRIALLLLNIIMYGCFLISFLCMKK